MATTNLLLSFPVLQLQLQLQGQMLPTPTAKTNPNLSFNFQHRHTSKGFSPLRSLANDFLGDFGARDPFPAEVESKFGDKVLGSYNTEHKILIPNISALSLSQQECLPVSPLQSPLSLEDANQLIRKVTNSYPTNLIKVTFTFPSFSTFFSSFM